MSDERKLFQLPRFERVAIPLKTTKEAEWVAQLCNYIMEMGDDPALFQNEIAQFHKMRQDLRGAPANSTGVEIIVNYYRQLDFLSKRLPLTEQPLPLSFTWYDAFEPNQLVKQSSLAFEKANVLFNLAAIFSQIDASNDNARCLQSAASVFTFIAENFLHPPLLDISRPSLLFLTLLMLAQAQEMVVFKAATDNKSPAVLARLAAATHDFFREAKNRLAGPESVEVRNYFESGHSTLGVDVYTFAQIKAGVWEIVSGYYMAEVAYKEDKIGEALSRLKEVERLSQVTLDFCPFENLTPSIEYLKGLERHVQNLLKLWNKENSLIYNQHLPECKSLPPIEATALVKVLSLTECCRQISEKPDLFKRLIPLKVHEEMSKYSEEKSKLLRYETLKVTSADSELQTTLSSLGFPAAIDAALKDQEGLMVLPEEFATLQTKASQLKTDHFLGQVDDLLGRINCLILEGNGMLDAEIASFQRSQIRYGQKWTQEPSHLGNYELFKELTSLQREHGKNLKVYNDLGRSISIELRDDIALLHDEKQLLAMLPKSDDVLFSQREVILKKVTQNLAELESLSRERSTGIEQLKEALLKDDISNTIATAKPQDSGDLFLHELAKFDSLCQNIEENICRHNSLLSNFKSLWEELNLLRHSDDSVMARKTLLLRFTGAYSQQLELERKLRALASDLEKVHEEVQSVLGKISLFIKSRAAERLKVERALESSNAEQGQAYLLEKLRSLMAKQPPPEEPTVRPPNRPIGGASNENPSRKGEGKKLVVLEPPLSISRKDTQTASATERSLLD